MGESRGIRQESTTFLRCRAGRVKCVRAPNGPHGKAPKPKSPRIPLRDASFHDGRARQSAAAGRTRKFTRRPHGDTPTCQKSPTTDSRSERRSRTAKPRRKRRESVARRTAARPTTTRRNPRITQRRRSLNRLRTRKTLFGRAFGEMTGRPGRVLPE